MSNNVLTALAGWIKPRPPIVEFECQDCRNWIVDISASSVPNPPLCMTCAFLNENVSDPAERVMLRRFLDHDRDTEETT
jgi:hypothetical protein